MSLLFNIDFLRENTEGDAELEAALMHHFESTNKRCLQILENTSNWDEITAALHELKGAAAAMGAEKLAECCGDFEAKKSWSLEQLTTLKTLTQETLAQMHHILR